MINLKKLLFDVTLWHVPQRRIVVTLVIWIIECLATTWIYFQSGIYLGCVIVLKTPNLFVHIGALVASHRESFLIDFSLFISSLASHTASGRSLRNALENCLSEPMNKNILLHQEMKRLFHLLKLGIPITEGLKKLSTHYVLEEANDLAQQIDHSERFGHDLSETMRRASAWISGQIQYRQFQRRSMLEKIFEFRLMSIMPLAILGILNFFYPEYLSALYSGVSGRFFMITAVIVLEMSSFYFEWMTLKNIET